MLQKTNIQKRNSRLPSVLNLYDDCHYFGGIYVNLNLISLSISLIHQWLLNFPLCRTTRTNSNNGSRWLNQSVAFRRHIAPEELWMYKYPPPTSSYVSSRDLWLLVVTFPLIVFAVEWFRRGLTDDILSALSAISLAYGLNGSITSYLKIIVGRPRPDFYYRCFPDGVGHDVSKCTGVEAKVTDGWKSFPSGHASFSFTCMVFMSCYICRKVALWGSVHGRSWRLCLVLAPLLIAASVAVSRTCDYHHHYADVICGSLLGTSIASVVYWLYFPGKNNPEKIVCTEE